MRRYKLLESTAEFNYGTAYTPGMTIFVNDVTPKDIGTFATLEDVRAAAKVHPPSYYPHHGGVALVSEVYIQELETDEDGDEEYLDIDYLVWKFDENGEPVLIDNRI